MRRRNCRVEIYFTKEELDALTKKHRKAGMSREGYCRRVLNDYVVKEAPPADLHILIMEIRRVGSNIDQILKKAHGIGFIDMPMLRKELANLAEVENTIINAYSMVED